ncbi:MAG: protein kinase [Planctomycetes bacterium]|nr:protein kinase [Planctomycetota bacterium]
MSYKNTCPEEADIYNYIMSKDEGEEDLQLTEHLQKCQVCSNVVNEIEAFEEKLVVINNKPHQSAEKLRIEKFIGKFQIVSPIGSGGMGDVHKAYEPNLNRYVAVKILKKEFANDKEFRARFISEAKSIAQINSPNVVQVYDFGEEAGNLYLAMEYIQGVTLSNYPISDRSDPEVILPIFKQLLYGMQIAHKEGIIHRDIKSSNIMIDKNNIVKILDFGLAKSTAIDCNHTMPGTILGTVAYMAPEVACGETATKSSDIYSLGIVLYELITGRLPYHADTPLKTIDIIKSGRVTFNDENQKQIPKLLRNLVLNMCHKNPEERYEDISQIIKGIESNKTTEVEDSTVPSEEAEIEMMLQKAKVHQNETPQIMELARKIEEERAQELGCQTLINIGEEMSLSSSSVKEAIQRHKDKEEEKPKRSIKPIVTITIAFFILMGVLGIILPSKDFMTSLSKPEGIKTVSKSFPEDQKFYLTFLEPVFANTSESPIKVNQKINGNIPLIEGNPARQYIGVEGDTHIRYNIPKGCESFYVSAMSLKNDNVIFKVICDNVEVFKSKTLSSYDNKCVNIYVKLPPSANTLDLVTIKDGPEKNQPIWSNPTFILDQVYRKRYKFKRDEFSDWLLKHEIDTYEQKNRNKIAGCWPTGLEGRLSERGIEYRWRYSYIPVNKYFWYMISYSEIENNHRKIDENHTKNGFKLVSGNHYVDVYGNKRYTSLWHKISQ